MHVFDEPTPQAGSNQIDTKLQILSDEEKENSFVCSTYIKGFPDAMVYEYFDIHIL